MCVRHYNFHVVTNSMYAIQEPTTVMVSGTAAMVQMKVTVSIHIITVNPRHMRCRVMILSLCMYVFLCYHTSCTSLISMWKTRHRRLLCSVFFYFLAHGFCKGVFTQEVLLFCFSRRSWPPSLDSNALVVFDTARIDLVLEALAIQLTS